MTGASSVEMSNLPTAPAAIEYHDESKYSNNNRIYALFQLTLLTSTSVFLSSLMKAADHCRQTTPPLAKLEAVKCLQQC